MFSLCKRLTVFDPILGVKVKGFSFILNFYFGKLCSVCESIQITGLQCRCSVFQASVVCFLFYLYFGNECCVFVSCGNRPGALPLLDRKFRLPGFACLFWQSHYHLLEM